MPESKIQIGFTPPQQIIFNHPARFKVVVKGRRFGFTHSVSLYTILQMLEKPGFAVMWGDTITGNIERYVERYWLPVLKTLPKDIWTWGKQNKVLKIGDSYCDFRSADRPENWEGFGYDLIVLNEAGIILKDDYLWSNAVRPMLLDNPNSKAIIGGTPKGKKNKGKEAVYYKLSKFGNDPDKTDWQSFHYTTYENPLILKEDVDALIKEENMGADTVAQEMMAKFLDTDALQFIPDFIIQKALAREYSFGEINGMAKVIGVDFAPRRDRNVIVQRYGNEITDISIFRPSGDIDWTQQFADMIGRAMQEFKPDAVFLDAGNGGDGVAGHLKQTGFEVIPVDFGERANNPQAYKNKRAEIYGLLRDWLRDVGKIPDDKELIADLGAVDFGYTKKRQIILQPKAELYESTDVADAAALTFAHPVVPNLRVNVDVHTIGAEKKNLYSNIYAGELRRQTLQGGRYNSIYQKRQNPMYDRIYQ